MAAFWFSLDVSVSYAAVMVEVGGTRARPSLAAAARLVADARKQQIGSFTDPKYGLLLALDLMDVKTEDLEPGHRLMAQIIADTHARGLRNAELIVADADLTALIDVAAPSMPDQILLADDPIAPHGLLLWATPLPDRTGQEPVVPIEMMSWTTVEPGDPMLHGDQVTGVLITAYVGVHALMLAMGVQPPAVVPRYVANATVMWIVGTPIGSAFGRTPGTDGSSEPGFYQRALAAFWTLAKQPLTQEHDSDRPMPVNRKRFARAGVLNPGAPVRLISLRHAAREKIEPGEETGRHVTVRYIVNPYWRDTYYGKEGVHRQQLVAGSVRGPAGAPLKGGEKVLLVTGKDFKP